MQIKSVLNGKEINLTGDNATIKSNNFNVDKDGNMTCKNATVTGNVTASSGKIAGYTIKGNMLVGANVGISGISGEGWAFWSGSNDAGSAPFKVGHDGSFYALNSNIQGTVVSNNAIITGGKFNVSGYGSNTDLVRVTNSDNSSQFSYLQPIGAGFVNGDYRIDVTTGGEYSDGGTLCSIDVYDSKGTSTIRGGGIRTPQLTQTSLSTEKKNFEKLQNALEIIKNIDIYKYNLKDEKDNTKKHIGFVIGDDFKYSQDVTSQENDGVDVYSFVSLCCKAIQEQQKMIEELQTKLKEVEEKVNEIN